MTTPIFAGSISFYSLMMFFFVFGFLGWIVEVIFATVKTGKFVNRGFLNGPFCPIYGVGVAVLVFLLKPLSQHWYLLFVAGGLFATLLELVTGFVLEKVFKTKWWDYSKEHFNFKGYICLKFTLIWAVAILAVFYTVVPLTEDLVDLIPFEWWGLAILILFWVSLIFDLVGTVLQLKKLNTRLKELTVISKALHKDSNAVGGKVSAATLVVMNKFKALGEKVKNSRLGKAFPVLGKKHTDEAELLSVAVEKQAEAYPKTEDK